jgi:hypothetical protein
MGMVCGRRGSEGDDGWDKRSYWLRLEALEETRSMVEV